MEGRGGEGIFSTTSTNDRTPLDEIRKLKMF